MSREERIQYMLKIAARVEFEGNARMANLFRRMAEDSRPVDTTAIRNPFTPTLDCCPE